MNDFKLKAVLSQIFILSILSYGTLPAQNLLANGDFELTNNCSKYGYGCAPKAWFRFPPIELPLYLRNLDLVYDGEKSEIIIVENHKHPGKLKLYLYSLLLCPLEPGEEYTLSFYLNPIYDKNYKLEVAFTDRELIRKDITPLDLKPDISFSNETSIVKKNKWIKKEAKFIADGDELFINFGNFSSAKHIVDKKDIPRNSRDEIYYLIDNISLIKSKNPSSNTCDISVRKGFLYDTNRRHTYDTVKIIPNKADLEKALLEKKEAEKRKSYNIPNFAFGVDKFSIRDGYYEALDELVTMLNTFNIISIEIIGHTDDSGDSEYNQTLSEKRANAIHEYLSEYIHVEYKVSGKGETLPLFPNTSIQNRAINRRVQVIVNME